MLYHRNLKNCYVILVALFIGSISANAQHIIDTISVRTLPLKGQVKYFKEITSECKETLDGIAAGRIVTEGDFQEKEYNFHSNYAYSFDGKGRMLKSEEYRSISKPYETKEVTYGSHGISQILTHFDFPGEGRRTAKTFFKYDEKGQLSQISLYAIMGTLASRRILSYDSKGNLVKDADYDNEGDVSDLYSYVYKYGASGSLLFKQETYSKYGKVDTITSDEYDESGRVIHHKYIIGGDIILKDDYYTYNPDSTIDKIEDKRRGDNTVFGVTTYHYEDGKLVLEKAVYPRYTKTSVHEDNITKVTYHEDGQLKYNKTYVDGRISEIVMADGTVYSYEYVIDTHGNWTQAVERKNSVPVLMKKRTILYY